MVGATCETARSGRPTSPGSLGLGKVRRERRSGRGRPGQRGGAGAGGAGLERAGRSWYQEDVGLESIDEAAGREGLVWRGIGRMGRDGLGEWEAIFLELSAAAGISRPILRL